MNDPNKKIDVNISSLLSLKAELLRKQQEVNRAKTLQISQPFVPKSFERPAVKEKPSEGDQPAPRTVELEDNEQLDRSRRILEAKSKFYDRMTASGGAVNTDDTCLVMFNAKKQTEKPSSPQGSSSDDGGINDDDDDEDWVEYTDSLGRTRRCLKTDLEFFKKRDETLAKELGEGNEEKNPSGAPYDDPTKLQSEESESEDELLKTGRLVQQMRDQWEKQDEENKDKEFVHYQDVLFDEARTHGVGYYQFSTDGEERLKQQKDLDIRRKATLAAQGDREAQRTARERIIAERVLAAKNRQRARLGLPPLDKIEGPEASQTAPEEVSKEDEKIEKSEAEAQRELDRQSHLRPWDMGKEGTSHLVETKEWTYRGQKEPMSQEEWNEKKRTERISEFAPTQTLNMRKKEHKRSLKESSIDVETNIKNIAENEDIDYHEEEEEQRGLFFTSKKKLKRKNYHPEETSIPIRTGVQVPPPPTFDYYGPPILGLAKKPKDDASLETSIAAGLKFLRNQTDKGQSSSSSLWGANANYGKD